MTIHVSVRSARFTFFALLIILLMAGLACSMPGLSTPEPEKPTGQPASPEPVSTSTSIPAVEPTPELPPPDFTCPIPFGALDCVGKGALSELALSPDGSTLVLVGAFGIHARDAKSFDMIWQMETPAALTATAISPDGAVAAAGADNGDITLFDLAGGQELFTISASEQAVSSITFTPEGTHFAATSLDGLVRLWDASSGGPVITLEAHSDAFYAVDIATQGGWLAAGDEAGYGWVWAAGQQSASARLTGHEGAVHIVAFSPDSSRLVTGGEDGLVQIWSMEDFSVQTALIGPDGVLAVLWDDSGESLLAQYASGDLWRWEIAAGTSTPLTQAGIMQVNSLAVSPDGTLYFQSPDRAIVAVNGSDGSLINAFYGYTAPAFSFALTTGGQAASGGPDATITRWQVGSPDERSFYSRAGSEPVWSVAWQNTENPALAAGFDGGSVVIFDESGTPVWSAEPGSTVWSVAFSPGGTALVAGTEDKAATVYNLETGEIMDVLRAHRGGVRTASYSPDGSVIATGGKDFNAMLWDASNGKQASLLTLDDWVNAVAWAYDGNAVAFGAGSEIVVLSGNSREPARTFDPAHTSPIRTVAYSPDSSLILSGDYDGIIAIHDAGSGEVIRRLEGHRGIVTGIAFLADGTLVTTGTDGYTIFWNISE